MIRKLGLAVVLLLTVAVAQAGGMISQTFTASTNTGTTHTLTISISGQSAVLVDDIYISYPGTDDGPRITIKNVSTGLSVYTTTLVDTTQYGTNKNEVNSIDTWIANGSTINVYLDKAATATGSTITLRVFYSTP